jgi:hypothetical protein
MVALLPESALVEAMDDPTLAVRDVAAGETGSSGLSDPPLTRQVVVVTTSDRLEIPPIQHFYRLVTDLLPRRIQAAPEAECSV